MRRRRTRGPRHAREADGVRGAAGRRRGNGGARGRAAAVRTREPRRIQAAALGGVRAGSAPHGDREAAALQAAAARRRCIRGDGTVRRTQMWYDGSRAGSIVACGMALGISLHAAQTPRPKEAPLETTRWKATELGGKRVPPPTPGQEIFLVFDKK